MQLLVFWHYSQGFIYGTLLGGGSYIKNSSSDQWYIVFTSLVWQNECNITRWGWVFLVDDKMVLCVHGYIFYVTRTKSLQSSKNGRPWSKNQRSEDHLCRQQRGVHLRRVWNIPERRRSTPWAKTPEQNRVTEHMNRTLVETARSMLVISRLPWHYIDSCLSMQQKPCNWDDTIWRMKRRKASSWWAMSCWVSNIRAYSQGQEKEIRLEVWEVRSFGYGTTTKGYQVYDPQKTGLDLGGRVMGVATLSFLESQCIEKSQL